jgi:hypothetical protein
MGSKSGRCLDCKVVIRSVQVCHFPTVSLCGHTSTHFLSQIHIPGQSLIPISDQLSPNAGSAPVSGQLMQCATWLHTAQSLPEHFAKKMQSRRLKRLRTRRSSVNQIRSYIVSNTIGPRTHPYFPLLPASHTVIPHRPQPSHRPVRYTLNFHSHAGSCLRPRVSQKLTCRI